jgi:uncharacterized membrane protein
MKGFIMFRFIRTTVLGGLLFLFPIVFVVAIIGKALEITNKLSAPLAGLLSVDSIGGLAVVELLALVILVLICFLAGLAARTALAGKLAQSLETKVLGKIPAYTLLKSKAESVLRPEDIADMCPVLGRFDDSWQLAFEIERMAGGKVVVFLPGAPDPWSGSVCVMTEDRITPLDMTVKSAADIMKRLGKGSTGALRDPLSFNKSSV